MTNGAMAPERRISWYRKWDADLSELIGSGFLRNVVGSLGSRAVLLALSVLTAVIVTRALGPQGRGLYATAVALSAIGIQVGNLGLHASNTWAVARDRSLLAALVANSLLASVAVGGAIALLIALAVSLWPDLAPLDIDLLLLTLVSIPIGLTYLLLQSLLLGSERIRVYNALEVAKGLAATLVLIGLVSAGLATASSAYAVVAVLTGLAGLAAFGLLTKGLTLPMRPSRTLIFENARYGLKAYVAAMVAFLLLRVDILIVQMMLGAKETGFYAVAVSLADNIYLLPVVVGTLLFARLSGVREARARWRIAKTAVAALAVVMTVLVIAAGFLAAPVVRILFGSEFVPSVAPFVWLLPGILFLSFNTPLMNYFAAEGMPVVVVIGPLAGLVTNVLLNVALIPSIGILGASIASSVSYGVMLLASLVYLTRKRPPLGQLQVPPSQSLSSEDA